MTNSTEGGTNSGITDHCLICHRDIDRRQQNGSDLYPGKEKVWYCPYCDQVIRREHL